MTFCEKLGTEICDVQSIWSGFNWEWGQRCTAEIIIYLTSNTDLYKDNQINYKLAYDHVIWNCIKGKMMIQIIYKYSCLFTYINWTDITILLHEPQDPTCGITLRKYYIDDVLVVFYLSSGFL